MLKINSSQNILLPFNPWIYFLIFLISNILLSYFIFSFETTLWIGILGLILPFTIGLLTYKPIKNLEIPLFKLELFEKTPTWGWVIICILAFFFRFYRLTTLSLWPTYDEGNFGCIAIEIMQRGINHFLYTFSSVPLFYPWFLSSVFKLFGTSLFNFWFCSAFFSILWVPLAYLAARSYFSKSFSFFCVLLAAFFFWPCYSGRYSECVVLILPLEALAFLWLGKCLNSKSQKSGDWFAGILGLSLGISFYAVYWHSFSVVIVIGSTMTLLYWKTWPRRLIFFGSGLTFPLIPLFFDLHLKHDPFFYTHTLSILGKSQPLLEKLQQAWITPKVMLWGTSNDEFFTTPVWGGLINPILGALLGIGLIETIKNSTHTLYQWLCVSFLFFLLPGMLSSGFDSFRIIPVLIVLIPIIGIGLARLTRESSYRFSTAILFLLLFTSVILDFNQLLEIYPRLWDSSAYWQKEFKSITSYRAYKILEPKFLEGPGLVFCDFVPGFDDQNLNWTDFSFNGINNHQLDWEKTNWVALLINVNYQPFLVKRFGTGKTYWLSKDLNSADGGQILWIINVTKANRPIFQKWREASRALNDYIYENLEVLNPADNHDSLLETLKKAYPLFHGDPFLEACYGEKKADLLFRLGRIPQAEQSLNQAIQKGYPAANLFYRLGTLQMIQGNKPESQKSFQKATYAPINLTQSAQFLTSNRKN